MSLTGHRSDQTAFAPTRRWEALGRSITQHQVHHFRRGASPPGARRPAPPFHREAGQRCPRGVLHGCSLWGPECGTPVRRVRCVLRRQAAVRFALDVTALGAAALRIPAKDHHAAGDTLIRLSERLTAAGRQQKIDSDQLRTTSPLLPRQRSLTPAVAHFSAGLVPNWRTMTARSGRNSSTGTPNTA